jgi:hypothetical protein
MFYIFQFSEDGLQRRGEEPPPRRCGESLPRRNLRLGRTGNPTIFEAQPYLVPVGISANQNMWGKDSKLLK